MGPDDAEAHHEAVGADPAVTWDNSVRTLRQTHENLARYLAHWRDNGFGVWGVVPREQDRLAGHAGLQRLEDGPDVELAYYLGRRAWGRGYATEAAAASLAFGFDQLELARIVAVVRPHNDASQRVLAKLGMTHEHDGRYYDVVAQLWSLRREDWRGARAA